MKYFKISYLFIIIIIANCSDNSLNSDEIPIIITLDEIQSQKITTFVDKELNLQTKIYWYSSNWTWEGPSDTTFAGSLKLKFENADQYIEEDRFKNQERGDLYIKSPFIEKRMDENLIEKYYYNEDSLSNLSTTYIFSGTIQYRDWLNVTEEYLQDSVFINQSNNVVYWSQTFVFHVEEIISNY